MSARQLRAELPEVRTVRADRLQTMAACRECAWAREPAPGGHWLAVRAAARRHTASTGHVTMAYQTSAWTYAHD